MWHQPSFQKVLEEQIIKDSTATSPQAKSIQDPAHLAFLIGKIPKVQFQKTSQYKSQTRVFTAPARLNETEKQAYLKFYQWGVMLPKSFSNIDLKTAFRRLALQLHPDQGGSHEDFLDLKRAYFTLRESIK